MSDEIVNLKLQQFDEFFSIKHKFNINIKPLNNGKDISYHDFIKSMPTAFKLANDIDALDQAVLAPLGVISGVAGQLVKYLNHQAQKIDLLVNYMLSEQDNEEYRYQATAFGGGGIEFTHTSPLTLHDVIEVKVFVVEENCAIYCYAEVINIEEITLENTQKEYHHKVIFSHIREDDREILVRSSLRIQSKQLQQLAKERSKQSNDKKD